MHGPTAEDLARDLRADLALCDADQAEHGDLSPGPWRESRIACHDAEGDFCGHDLYVLDANGEEIGGMGCYDDNALVVAARTGWPAAIRRALAAEAESARLRALLRDHDRLRDERDALLADAREVGRVIGCDHPHDGHGRCVRDRIEELEAEVARQRALIEWHRELVAMMSGGRP